VIYEQPSNTGSPYALGAWAYLFVTAFDLGAGDLAGNLTYQWYTTSSGSVYDTTNPIGSATGSEYTPPTTAPGIFYYYVKVTSTNAAATGITVKTLDSDIVAITVNGGTDVRAPVIYEQPSNTGSPYALGAWAYLSVTAFDLGAGDLAGTLTYQWYTTSSSSIYDTTNPIGSATGTAYTPAYHDGGHPVLLCQGYQH
jgi:hypothetical protein